MPEPVDFEGNLIVQKMDRALEEFISRKGTITFKVNFQEGSSPTSMGGKGGGGNRATTVTQMSTSPSTSNVTPPSPPVPQPPNTGAYNQTFAQMQMRGFNFPTAPSFMQQQVASHYISAYEASGTSASFQNWLGDKSGGGAVQISESMRSNWERQGRVVSGRDAGLRSQDTNELWMAQDYLRQKKEEIQESVRADWANPNVQPYLDRLPFFGSGKPGSPGRRMSEYYSAKYFNEYAMNPSMDVGFATWMGNQTPMSAGMASQFAATTSWKPSGPNFQQTAAYTPQQLGQIKQWGQSLQPNAPLLSNSQISAMLKGGMVVAGDTASAMAQASVQETMTGHSSIASQGRIVGQFLGGIAGAGVGALFPNPYTPIIGASIGAKALGDVADMVTAPLELAYQITHTMGNVGGISSAMKGISPIVGDDRGGAFGLNPGAGNITPGGFNEAKRYRKFIDGKGGLQEKIKAYMGDANSEYWPDPKDLAAGFASTYEGLVQGGFDAGTIIGSKGNSALEKMYRQMSKDSSYMAEHGNFGIRGYIEAKKSHIYNTLADQQRPTTEELAEAMFTNIAMRYPMNSAEVGKQVGTVASSYQMTGGNALDMLMRHGAISTGRFFEALTPYGQQPEIGLRQLMNTQVGIQSGEREAQLAQLSIRNSGIKSEIAYKGTEVIMASLPGGKDSVAYAQVHKSAVNSGFLKEHQEDVLGYDLPMARINALAERAQFLPYMPGYSQKTALQGMSMRGGQIKKLMGRYSAHMAAGDYSEDQQLQMAQTIYGMQNEQYRDMGILAQGGENRMMALSSGRPGFFSRVDSEQLAALSLKHIGAPWNRKHGAVGGSQIRSQNDFIHSFATDDFDAMGSTSPRAQRSAVDAGLEMKALVSALDRLNGTLKTGAGTMSIGGKRMGEDVGKAAGTLGIKDTAPKYNYDGNN
jgi:hypothetical protein